MVEVVCVIVECLKQSDNAAVSILMMGGVTETMHSKPVQIPK